MIIVGMTAFIVSKERLSNAHLNENRSFMHNAFMITLLIVTSMIPHTLNQYYKDHLIGHPNQEPQYFANAVVILLFIFLEFLATAGIAFFGMVIIGMFRTQGTALKPEYIKTYYYGVLAC